MIKNDSSHVADCLHSLIVRKKSRERFFFFWFFFLFVCPIFARMKIKGVLIDLSGTLHVDNTIISGAVESIQK